ncbi:ParB N-terminal domain-containing protein [Fulvivirgaceae bacterium PWU4]|uniref:ParB N-terminal domain-containing protein n=1 Tax=Chryseosolibacter histidini TaxID=2782349 RepID=A0AAP2DI34_9BACT|nr:ParB N-terminal domain-containing protein [Chryseosolibacter histidini]MBT1695427.1 ParB N-terminal domain-containing protein [Chryseosolibacter histidini]
MVEGSSITVLKVLKDFILPLSAEEFNILEQSILSDGCRDPLIVWQKPDGTNILVDGHNRLKICQKHGLPYKIKKLGFSDMDQVKDWMLDNQMGRRNLTPDQMSYYRGVKYLSIKQAKGGYKNIQSKGQSGLSTSEVLAGQFKVSESTIKRDAKFAEGVEIIGKSNPSLKLQILSGESKIKKADIRILTEHKESDKLTFRNEADLFNKAKRIRDEILDEVEQDVKRIKAQKITKAQETLKSLEPAFLNKEDRMKKIKASIVSVINRAINDKDVTAIKELKKLIERLEGELFD